MGSPLLALWRTRSIQWLLIRRELKVRYASSKLGYVWTVLDPLFTCLVFLLIGWTGGTYYVTALSIGGIVCIASSNGGTTSQDLKTGFLIGSTPRLQQISILIGALASALLMGPILLKLNDTATVYIPAARALERASDVVLVGRSVEHELGGADPDDHDDDSD